MATDYVLFVHGVKQRQPDEFNRTTQTLLEGVAAAPPDYIIIYNYINIYNIIHYPVP